MHAATAVSFDEVKPVLLGAGQSYLRRLMRKRGLTVTALAAELGISRKHLSNALNGCVPLLDPLLGRLCQALEIDRTLLVCLLDDGVRPPARSAYGCMKGTIEVNEDPTEPMEGWEMLEDQ